MPDQTPVGLKSLRAEELQALSQECTSERLPSDRIYDYDVCPSWGPKLSFRQLAPHATVPCIVEVSIPL